MLSCFMHYPVIDKIVMFAHELWAAERRRLADPAGTRTAMKPERRLCM